MKRRVVYVIFALILVAVLSMPAVRAEVVVNEVMVNEPGSQSALEWFELYNNSSAQASMNLYYAVVGAYTVTFSGVTLPAYGYLLVCRDTAAVRVYWSDDIPAETPLYEGTFSLANSAGTISLHTIVLISELSWNSAGEDGVSWERKFTDASEVWSSTDGSGGTPGFLNSVSLVPYDLSLEDIAISSLNDTTWLTFVLVNRGENLMTGGVLSLFYYDEKYPDDESQVIAELDIPLTDTGYTTVIREPFVLDGQYVSLGAALNDDDRLRNNRIYFFAPGAEYPPFVISEFLANPATALGSEWIELKNRFNISMTMAGWFIGDEGSLYPVSGTPLAIEPNEYFVLVEDSLAFLSFYPEYAGRCLQPAQWPRLNNDTDVVRLVDSFGVRADSFAYVETFDDNITWARSETVGYENYWGQSSLSGGTPGAENDVQFKPPGGRLSLNIEPKIIAPDGDGRDEYAVITFDGPTDARYTLRLFDRRGKLVRTFFDDASAFDEQYLWDGTAGDGRRLPIGIYIVYLEAPGVGQIKETVVLAR
ncbi:MAG: hypothetical protein ACOYVF_06470 [Candidatus Zixiibacteriota bacterium]